MAEVFVRGLDFYGFHGVSAEERLVGHRFRVDAWVRLDAAASETDLLADTLDYGALVGALLETARDAPCATVERLARRMAETALARFPQAREARVRLVKLLPPVDAVLAEAGVELALRRGPDGLAVE